MRERRRHPRPTGPVSDATDYIRHVVRLDLDKTYLRSEFDTLQDLIKSAMEPAAQKKAFPGAAALLRALRQNEGCRICIVSGSPTQMRQVLAAKLRLDGIEFDEFVLKNNLRNILRGRLRAVRAQVPYKLPTLLASRVAMNTVAPETLFGDDAEADAIVYSLYADLLAGKVPEDELARILRAARAYDDEVESTLELTRKLVHQDSVQRVLIHLDQRSPTATFTRFGSPAGADLQLLPGRPDPLRRRRAGRAPGLVRGPGDAVLVRVHDRHAGQLAAGSPAPRPPGRGRGRTPGRGGGRGRAQRRALGRRGSAALRALARVFADRVRHLGGAPPLEWPAEHPLLDYVSMVDAEHEERSEKKRSRVRNRRR